MSELSRGGKDVLTITQINYIQDLYFLEGKSISEICRMTEKNYRTVKKYIEQDDFNPKKHKVKRSNKSNVLSLSSTNGLLKISLDTINKGILPKGSMIG